MKIKLVLAVVLLSLNTATAQQFFGGGSGTEDDPYQI